MFGEAVTSCHIRVPISSKPKYCSVSRFSNTASRSRKRTRACAGATARPANENIGTAPPREPRPSNSVCARGLPQAEYSTGHCHASPRARHTRKRSIELSRFLFLHIYLGVDTRSDLLQSIEPLFGLLAPDSVAIELDSLLVSLNRPWLNNEFQLVTDLFSFHRAYQGGRQ